MKSKNNEKTCCFEKLTDACCKSEKLFRSFKISVLVCAVLFILATVMYLLVGFNFSNELADKYVISVDYKSTLSSENIATYEDKITTLAEDNKLYNIYFEHAGEVTTTKLVVNIVADTNNSEVEKNVESLQKAIEDFYIVDIPEIGVDEAVVQEFSFRGYAGTAILAIGIFMVALFIFVWIRHEILTAAAAAFQVLFNVATLFALMVICRIPFAVATPAVFGVMAIVSSLAYLLVADRIRAMEVSEQNITNYEAVTKANKQVMPVVLVCFLAMLAASIVFMIYALIASSSIFSIVLASIVALIISFYSAFFFAPSFWIETYKRDRDKRLKARIEKEAKKNDAASSKKSKGKDAEDEKIVV